MENLFVSARFVGDSTDVVRIEAKTDEAAGICALCSLGKTFCDRIDPNQSLTAHAAVPPSETIYPQKIISILNGSSCFTVTS